MSSSEILTCQTPLTEQAYCDIEQLQHKGFKIAKVGRVALSAISELDAVGNVLARVCPSCPVKVPSTGIAEHCQNACQVKPDAVLRSNEPSHCAEVNLHLALDKLNVDPKKVIFADALGNSVGFEDLFSEYEYWQIGIQHPRGWRQVYGFSAFFADADKAPVIGRGLADCGDLNVEFATPDGRIIIGYVHLTRPNQAYGKSCYAFTYKGRNVSYVEYALRQAADHYGMDTDSCNLSLRTALKAEDFAWHFDCEDTMEHYLPGWAEEGRILDAQTGAPIAPGEPVDENRLLLADARGLFIDNIYAAMTSMGIAQRQLDLDNLIDTKNDLKHSSHSRAIELGLKDSRDGYFIIHPRAYS